MFYADFAYYFGCQFIFWFYDIILKYIPYPLPKKHKKTLTPCSKCVKKKRDLAGFVRNNVQNLAKSQQKCTI